VVVAPRPKVIGETDAAADARAPKPSGTYRPWAELRKRTLGVDVLECPKCKGRMKLLALVTEDESVRRFLAKLSEPTTAPERSPSRGPPYWKSVVLHRKALGYAA
jgi:hypothetical protein